MYPSSLSFDKSTRSHISALSEKTHFKLSPEARSLTTSHKHKCSRMLFAYKRDDLYCNVPKPLFTSQFISTLLKTLFCRKLRPVRRCCFTFPCVIYRAQCEL